tara:strand:+ start:93 stop:440 length:348 start_codon:yes stop_codon:yes gene_type:complete
VKLLEFKLDLQKKQEQKILKVGDLIKYVPRSGLEFSPHSGRTGIIVRIDKDHFGARQAFKRIPRPREHCINSLKPDTLAPTASGIRDRIMVLWGNDHGFEYIESIDLEVISVGQD